MQCLLCAFKCTNSATVIFIRGENVVNASSKQNRVVNIFPLVWLTMQLKLQTVGAPRLAELHSHFFSVPPGPPSPIQRGRANGTSPIYSYPQGSHSFCQKIVGEDYLLL